MVLLPVSIFIVGVIAAVLVVAYLADQDAERHDSKNG